MLLRPLSKSCELPLPAMSIAAGKVNTCCCQMFGDGRVKADPRARPGRFLSETSHAVCVSMPFMLKEPGGKREKPGLLLLFYRGTLSDRRFRRGLMLSQR